jgi:(2Fe-2S) ferredoxin
MMAEQIRSPFVCHVFVCTHDRGGKEESCADKESSFIRKSLKQGVADRGWKKRVRVSQCGCVGQCEKGPMAIIYPQNIWFSDVSPDDVGLILAEVKQILDNVSLK